MVDPFGQAAEPITVKQDGTEYLLRPILGGWCLKRVGPHHCVDLLRMLFNWRIARSPREVGHEHHSTDRAWCYTGTGHATFQTALQHALAWDGADDTAPAGFAKQAYPPKERHV